MLLESSGTIRAFLMMPGSLSATPPARALVSKENLPDPGPKGESEEGQAELPVSASVYNALSQAANLCCTTRRTTRAVSTLSSIPLLAPRGLLHGGASSGIERDPVVVALALQ